MLENYLRGVLDSVQEAPSHHGLLADSGTIVQGVGASNQDINGARIVTCAQGASGRALLPRPTEDGYNRSSFKPILQTRKQKTQSRIHLVRMVSSKLSPPAGTSPVSLLYPAALCAFMVQHGLSKKSLSHSGAVAATVVGLGTFTNSPYVFGSVLLTFYLSSSKLTKFKSQIKKTLEEDHQEGGGRTAIQVFSNGAVGTVLALAYQYVYWTSESRPATLFMNDWRASTILFAYIGHYACCNGDTWASELGILNKSWPTLITTLKKVPPGTNGGVSPLGLAASFGGGLLIGVAAAISVVVQLALEAPISWKSGKGWTGLDAFSKAADAKFLFALLLAGAGAGFFGSLLDSVLGATVQKSNYSTKNKVITYKAAEKDDEIKPISGFDILDNHQVNFFSSMAIALATGYLSWKALW